MIPDPPPPWVAWSPPLNPPSPDGLPYELAADLAADWWDVDRHRFGAEAWEAYAATLDPTPSVSSVQTGAQSVAYSPAQPSGAYGRAVARAAWHRSLCSNAESVPLIRDLPIPVDPWRLEPWAWR